MRLLVISEPFDLVLCEVLCAPGTPTRCVSFPGEGFISLVTVVPGHPGVEVGMVGSEGLVGAHLALDVTIEPLHTVVQGADRHYVSRRSRLCSHGQRHAGWCDRPRTRQP